jgi:type I restriction enzyme R subunit
MLGRATRLCSDIGKTHFEIYDPVGVCESLEPVSTMKPIVQKESASFDDLLNGLETLNTEEQLKNQIELIIAKVQRKKRNLADNALSQFVDVSKGLNPTEFIETINDMTSQNAKEYILKNTELFQILNEGGLPSNRPMFFSDKEDELISHTRGYGDGMTSEDYLEEFSKFIKTNINTIAALNVVCNRPRELTRESLKSLKLELDRHNFTEQMLNTAWREWKNEEIAADIISYIRRVALSSALISREERVKNAMDKLRKNHTFNKMELDWLSKIEKTLLNESIIYKSIFDEGIHAKEGGFKRIDKIFAGKLEDYIQEINSYLYDDEGKTA